MLWSFVSFGSLSIKIEGKDEGEDVEERARSFLVCKVVDVPFFRNYTTVCA